jgi:Ca-activated chloride channel family protein
MCASVLVAFVTIALGTFAQQQDSGAQQFPPLRVEVSLVSLTATVVDKSDKAITGLSKDDFEVYEDGALQNIAVFHNDETVPVSIGILFDTSGSMEDKIDDVQDAVVHFAQTTNPEDDIFLIRFSSSVSLVLASTSDRNQIKRAVRSLEPGGSTALYDAIVEGLERLQSGKQRKKALLLVTDGRDTSSQTRFGEAVATAKQSEAIIYALGIGHGEKGSFGHLNRFEDTVDIEALRQLAEPTGGRAVLLQGKHKKNGVDQIDQAALEVSAELRNQYTLGYYSTNKAKDGTFRRVEVKAKNPNYIVRTRIGYLAPKDTALQP